jgi:hypothetical protein
LHAGEQGYFAFVVVVNADTEVGLLRVGIGVESLGDAENRVARRHFNGSE